MVSEKIKARILYKLARKKGNWGGKYDRLEHFKRFSDLKKIVKDLKNKLWIKVFKKSDYTGISLNPHYKEEIVEFIEKHMPEVKGNIK